MADKWFYTARPIEELNEDVDITLVYVDATNETGDWLLFEDDNGRLWKAFELNRF